MGHIHCVHRMGEARTPVSPLMPSLQLSFGGREIGRRDSTTHHAHAQALGGRPRRAHERGIEQVVHVLVVDLDHRHVHCASPARAALDALEDARNRPRHETPGLAPSRAHHRVALAAAGLAVREARRVVPLEDAIDDPRAEAIEDVALRRASPEHAIERKVLLGPRRGIPQSHRSRAGTRVPIGVALARAPQASRIRVAIRGRRGFARVERAATHGDLDRDGDGPMALWRRLRHRHGRRLAPEAREGARCDAPGLSYDGNKGASFALERGRESAGRACRAGGVRYSREGARTLKEMRYKMADHAVPFLVPVVHLLLLHFALAEPVERVHAEQTHAKQALRGVVGWVGGVVRQRAFASKCAAASKAADSPVGSRERKNAEGDGIIQPVFLEVVPALRARLRKGKEGAALEKAIARAAPQARMRFAHHARPGRFSNKPFMMSCS